MDNNTAGRNGLSAVGSMPTVKNDTYNGEANKVTGQPTGINNFPPPLVIFLFLVKLN
jgi:hypothetical protein